MSDTNVVQVEMDLLRLVNYKQRNMKNYTLQTTKKNNPNQLKNIVPCHLKIQQENNYFHIPLQDHHHRKWPTKIQQMILKNGGKAFTENGGQQQNLKTMLTFAKHKKQFCTQFNNELTKIEM